MTTADTEERTALEICKRAIHDNLDLISRRLAEYSREIQDSHDYMWEARRDMDHIDKIAFRQTIDQKMRSSDMLRDQQIKLKKLNASPYFGRFDFRRDDAPVGQSAMPVYLGVYDFRDQVSDRQMVYDWRAPISSMFYDYEPGIAKYEAPSGDVHGLLERKRQFRIRHGRMELLLEADLNIVDDVLQDHLGQSSDAGMKQIVATIQRDQNAIIRNAEAHTLIIQGVAGSGKTSIALHRIAFLLYRFKDSLTSQDILIISPNKVFADYIGTVLPELGEEQVNEIGMETLADQLLGGKIAFQTFFEQTAALIEHDDAALRERIVAKSSLDLLRQLDDYADHVEAQTFTATEWRSGRKIVPAWHFEETWKKHKGLPLNRRVAELVSTTEHKIFLHYKQELQPQERSRLREAVKAMAHPMALKTAYKGFYDWLRRPELYQLAAGRKLEYADVFPMIYLKMRLQGVDSPYGEVKHLLVDEMQDYTAVQYAVIGKIFACRKTILGDAAQSVNPYSASTGETIQAVLRAATPVKLTKSYRSTWEIMQFALKISPNPDLIAMERHGDTPQITGCGSEVAHIGLLIEHIEKFSTSDHKSLAIIAKTQKQAVKIHRALLKAEMPCRLLGADSTSFSTGVLICTAHLAKGLEFDRVIVADACRENYATPLDRNLLYVACTRAMHSLDVTSVGPRSELLPNQD